MTSLHCVTYFEVTIVISVRDKEQRRATSPQTATSENSGNPMKNGLSRGLELAIFLYIFLYFISEWPKKIEFEESILFRHLKNCQF